MDLSKLSPAPWQKCGAHDGNCCCLLLWSRPAAVPIIEGLVASEESDGVDDATAQTNLEFVELARNDLDVKLRRGWHTEKCTEADQWLVPQLIEHLCGKSEEEGDALMAAMYQNGHDVGLLTKADRWYKENIESKP